MPCMPARSCACPATKARAKFDDVNGRGIVIARCKAKQNDDLFLVRRIIDRYGVVIEITQCSHVIHIDEQPFGYFRIAAAQIFRLDGIDGRNGAALFVGYVPEDGIEQAPIQPIIPKRRIGFIPA